MLAGDCSTLPIINQYFRYIEFACLYDYLGLTAINSR